MPRSLTVTGETFPLATPFRISRGVKTAADVVTVRIAQGEIEGRGESVPYLRYGESVADSIAEIEAVRTAIEGGVNRRGLLEILPAGAARNAVDCALWDLELRLEGRDFAAAAGIATPLQPIATAMTVGLDTPDKMGLAAAALADVPLIKVKVDASDLPVVRELATHDEDAVLVRPNSAKAIKDAALRFLAEPTLAARLREHGRRRVEQASGWNDGTTSLESVYQHVLSQID